MVAGAMFNGDTNLYVDHGGVLRKLCAIKAGDLATVHAADIAEANNNEETRILVKQVAEEIKEINRPHPVLSRNVHPPRNSLCPCGSGKKFKRCCRINPAP